MRRQLLPAVKMLAVLTVCCGLLYTFAITGVAQALLGSRADGSLVHANGRVVGSKLIGQPFTKPQYFHPRPSAAGDGYDPRASASSNLGPTNPDLLKTIRDRAVAYRHENGLAANAAVPADAVTASGSGLDPEISLANATLQAARGASARGMSVDAVMRLVRAHRSGRVLDFLGEPGVNVLEVNLALDRADAS
jgi:K+-transporting ATPase ATPase C chain